MTNDVTNKIKTPAIGLIVAGALNGLLGALTLLSGLLRLTGISGRETLPANDAERYGFYVGTIITYGIGLLSLLVAPIIIYGAIQMMRGRKYGLARASAILAIVPVTSCCFLISIPVGIWALIVLSKPDVKTFFQNGGASGRQFQPPPPPNNF